MFLTCVGTPTPTSIWTGYGGELWFYDNYIIPLANKIRHCKVFGVCCDEFIDFATDNRLEWEYKGKQTVAEWAEEIKRKEEEAQGQQEIAPKLLGTEIPTVLEENGHRDVENGNNFEDGVMFSPRKSKAPLQIKTFLGKK